MANQCKKIMASMIAVTFSAALVLISAAPADAGGWKRHRHHSGNAVAAGVVGFAAGMIIGNQLSYGRPRGRCGYRPCYVRPCRGYCGRRPVVYPQGYPHHHHRHHHQYRPTYGHPVYARPRPWTRSWYRYCARKYRSFDAASGTFQPYHGPRRLCR